MSELAWGQGPVGQWVGQQRLAGLKCKVGILGWTPTRAVEGMNRERSTWLDRALERMIMGEASLRKVVTPSKQSEGEDKRDRSSNEEEERGLCRARRATRQGKRSQRWNWRGRLPSPPRNALRMRAWPSERKPGTTRLSDGNLSDERQKLSLSHSLSLCDALA